MSDIEQEAAERLDTLASLLDKTEQQAVLNDFRRVFGQFQPIPPAPEPEPQPESWVDRIRLPQVRQR